MIADPNLVVRRPAHRDGSRRARLDPIDYIMGMPWCVIRSSQLDARHSLELDLQSQAIVLDVDVEHMDRVSLLIETLHSVLEQQREQGDGPVTVPPLVALVSLPAHSTSRSCSVKEARRLVSSAQDRLHTLGLDEVVLKAGEACDIHLSVSMALQRMEHTTAAWQEREAGIREELCLEAKAAMKAREAECRWQWAEDVWSCVGDRSIHSVLPPLDASLPQEIHSETVVGELRIDRTLGRGAFGLVALAQNMQSSNTEAVKIFPKTQHGTGKAMVQIAREVEALGRLRHENVVGYLGVMHAPRHLFVRMEYAGPGSLMMFLSKRECGRVPLPRARSLYRQVLAGLAHCHSRGVAHCDVKPENIAVDARAHRIKLVDFGCAAPLGTALRWPRGTMPFMGPEVCIGGGVKKLQRWSMRGGGSERSGPEGQAAPGVWGSAPHTQVGFGGTQLPPAPRDAAESKFGAEPGRDSAPPHQIDRDPQRLGAAVTGLRPSPSLPPPHALPQGASPPR